MTSAPFPAAKCLLSNPAILGMAGSVRQVPALHACGMLWLVSKAVAVKHGGVTRVCTNADGASQHMFQRKGCSQIQ